ncbi:MAG: hypothetical protein QE487_05465 [Fluviicola sp.]|nr:hypothetical protein [Fluviicola sp.]
MNFFSIFTNKNDLAKSLAIGGLMTLLFSLIYPIEKQKELDLMIVDCQYKKIELNGSIDEANTFIASLSNKDSKMSVADQKKIAMEMSAKLRLLKLEISHLDSKISVTRKYVNEYGFYVWLLFWGGLLGSLIGVLFWSISGIKEHNKNHP